jgi:hypothetical protein
MLSSLKVCLPMIFLSCDSLFLNSNAFPKHISPHARPNPRPPRPPTCYPQPPLPARHTRTYPPPPWPARASRARGTTL